MNKAMQIQIKYFAALREQVDKEEETVTTESSTAAELYDELQIKYHLTVPKENVGVAINGQLRSLNFPLSTGDTIVYIPPVSGG